VHRAIQIVRIADLRRHRAEVVEMPNILSLICIAVAFVVSSVTLAADRPRVVSMASASDTNTPEAAEGRTSMKAASPDDIQIKECLKMAETAANEENLDAFIQCFSAPLQQRLRRRLGLLFVQHEIGMEILDSHILKRSEATGELAVKYKTTLSTTTIEVVSVMSLMKQEHSWKISGENVVSYQSNGGVRSTSGGGCGGGRCDFGGCLPSIDDLLRIGEENEVTGCRNGRCGVGPGRVVQ
jgi:hypothetical protein